MAQVNHMDSITIKKPFDSHLHVRRGAVLRAVVPIAAEKFASAIIMPNVEPPIETVAQAAEYKKEILTACKYGSQTAVFEPLMTFYLTRTLKAEEIEKGMSSGVYAVKYYPYGATTNSQWGFRDILEAKEVLKEMERVGMPLLLHGEVHVDLHEHEVDPYEGERRFIEDVLPRLLAEYPNLKVSLEHMSTKVAADFMEKNGKACKLVATVTVHHLLYAREDIEQEPLLRCKPLIKSRTDRDAVRSLATKGLPFVSAGTDSAPHPEAKKFASPPAFGVFSSPTAVEMYAQVFDEMNALDNLEGFLSTNGPRFFGVEPAKETITLVKKDWQVTEPVTTDEGVKIWPVGHVEHGLGNETIHWQIAR